MAAPIPTRRFGRTRLAMPVLSLGGMRFQQSWSDLPAAEITAASQANLRAVLELILQVADSMRHDPDWADSILGTPEVLGVDELRQSGCLIRVWIQTLPLAQWPVGREFRLRVKEAFDREGTRLGLPRQ